MRNFYKSPSLIDISITNRCNLKCGFCYAESKVETYSNELNTEELKKIFEEIDKLNVHRVAISGGEPFVRKDIFDIIENFTSHDYSTIINTNATLINDSIAKNLKKYEIDRICVSLDGSNKVNHDAIRGSDTFEKTLKGIQNLQKYNLPVSTLFTLHNKNA